MRQKTHSGIGLDHDYLRRNFRLSIALSERRPTLIASLMNSMKHPLDLDPVLATEHGRTGVETLFGDYSPAGEEAYAKLVKKNPEKAG